MHREKITWGHREKTAIHEPWSERPQKAAAWFTTWSQVSSFQNFQMIFLGKLARLWPFLTAALQTKVRFSKAQSLKQFTEIGEKPNQRHRLYVFSTTYKI